MSTCGWNWSGSNGRAARSAAARSSARWKWKQASSFRKVQGKTDAQGNLLIPNVQAFGRQDLTLNDKQLSMEYNLARKRVTIAPAYRSGTVVNFGGTKLRAVAGRAWLGQDGSRKPVASR